ncbi:MAG: valine--tRNA ligase [Chloroflexi bacterium RBG_16_56_11]|nr:MAG: valine--tRNA ligase [Chloroflexi bacterium RBG_16_56_11]
MADNAEIENEMPRAYEPGRVEEKWYKFWMENGYFTPKIDKNKKPFVIIHPPTNVTGELHLGTALTATIQDIMVRWHRMKGEPTLWLPGIDHAGIATQWVVERLLAKEDLTRHQLGRDKFLERVWDWVKTYRHTIIEQHKRLGASLDWTRLRFTMDEVSSRAVRTTFGRLYQKGLIYRGERIINWCPRCATALSDLEVEHQDLKGHLWYVKYAIVGEKDKFITVATTRPETILGDTAVAVNPRDLRFKGMVGKKVRLPAVNREIPIVADEVVSTEFGTGAVKVTPAHDPVDFEIAQRQKLPLINIMKPDMTMNENAGPYAGMDRFECRKAIVADLEKEGRLVKIEPYSHAVGHCERCKTIVEPIASRQWFVKIEPLARPAIEAVVDGRIKIIPERFTKVYLNWMENIRDWCISRQLWWGHRIPIWYCRDCGGLTVALETPTACVKCNSKHIEQDPDTLDTWFSSALWPHSTLGWPDDTEDLRYFYPTSVMETGYDILFFWVARMIMMGIENTGEIPFHTVYLHGLIRDETGEKMSKTRGNVIAPIEVMEKYGTDALRFALTTGTSPGNDSRLPASKMEAGRNFANKLWNATRFVVRSLETGPEGKNASEFPPVEDRWILSRLNRMIDGVNGLMEDFQFGEAERQVHDFLWGEFCDWYIEFAKIRLQANDDSPLPVLADVLEKSLRMLHPFMPFLTEELWQNLKKYTQKTEAGSIMVAAYPGADTARYDPAAETEIETVREIVRSIRNVRAEHKVESQRWIEATVFANASRRASLARYSEHIRTLARASPVIFAAGEPEKTAGENTLVLPLVGATVVIPMASMYDIETEKKRVQKELEQTEAEHARLEVRLKDEAFLARAPQAVIEKERQKFYTLDEKLKKLKQQSTRIQEVK